MATTETRTCQNCQKAFTVEPDDFSFYEKMQVPPPTWCPECRFQRRLSWRNMWHLFRKNDEHTGEKILSLFPAESKVKIYAKEYWDSDAWDPMDYGKDYDWQKPFFAQFDDLIRAAPFPAHSMSFMSDCRFCMNANNLKSCYLVRASTYSENSAYLIWDNGSKWSMDSHMTDHCELGYDNVNVARSFKTLFSADCEDCSDVVLSKDCIGCSNCFGCIGLRNKTHHFFNQPCTKEEYERKLAELNLGSHKALREVQIKAHDFWKSFPQKYMHGRQNVRVSGDYIYESKNATDCYRVRSCEDVKFCQNILSGPVKDCYDYTCWGDGSELLYECLITGLSNARLKFCLQCYPNNRDLEYCIFCQKSADCFSCIGLKNKQYCIFNKQYTKEEYETLVPKIKKHMMDMPYRDGLGRTFGYGEFPPPELSFFPYHVSEANEFFPRTEEEAKSQGLAWYWVAREEYRATLSAKEIPDHVCDAKDTITQEIVGCGHGETCEHECTGAFRIIKEELELCRRLGIPLPRLCINCRHYERLALRNTARLHHRTCACAGVQSENGIYKNTATHVHATTHCPNEFETSYPPDSPAIVYCEQCYQAEVV